MRQAADLTGRYSLASASSNRYQRFMASAGEIFNRLCQPLAPLPTDTSPRLVRFPGVRAVLFDVYGTLIISASGDIGTSGVTDRPACLAAALQACGLNPAETSRPDIDTLSATIAQHHRQAREAGINYPEVNILEIWADVWRQWHAEQWVTIPADHVDFPRLAVEFEARVNPTWPMPGAERTLATLHQDGRMLGLVSNAQFFTPHLMTALFGRSLDELGFDPQLRYYSYEHRHAKPSPHMYRLAAAALATREIAAQEVLYVGNDVLNDVLPAAEVGFRTVLFAGDRRSLRWRRDDPLVAGVEPDAVVTDLTQILELCRN